mmetsp:Transcript_115251/g.298820  ORF Transcript_115251/g.298820 Transcript_115251/m.298820 type:complete len:227 (+) Transcript_115251:489-1169(+)
MEVHEPLLFRGMASKRPRSKKSCTCSALSAPPWSRNASSSNPCGEVASAVVSPPPPPNLDGKIASGLGSCFGRGSRPIAPGQPPPELSTGSMLRGGGGGAAELAIEDGRVSGRSRSSHVTMSSSLSSSAPPALWTRGSERMPVLLASGFCSSVGRQNAEAGSCDSCGTRAIADAAGLPAAEIGQNLQGGGLLGILGTSAGGTSPTIRTVKMLRPNKDSRGLQHAPL